MQVRCNFPDGSWCDSLVGLVVCVSFLPEECVLVVEHHVYEIIIVFLGQQEVQAEQAVGVH